MGAKETILTAEGLRKLEDELENLRSVKRQEVAERIKVAISYGDISENSEYDDAKNEQASRVCPPMEYWYFPISVTCRKRSP